MTTRDTAENLEVITVQTSRTEGRWKPSVGRELTALLKRKGFAEQDSRGVEEETCRILSRCAPPTARGDQGTGLVIGYVQSGKTLSFTALTALARDNRYRLVIVLGGTTTNLVEQSYARLAADLDIEGHGQRIWSMFSNPTVRADTTDEITSALRAWTAYPDRPERCPTVVIVVMKNHRHLTNLASVLQACDLEGVSTLIVDDEGDQAGLNNKVRQKEESRTYSCIRLLRKVFPTHTYLLYTATPQAPLLISRIDMLSPQFAEVIEPGKAYVGGKDLFGEKSPYVVTIPMTELPDDDASGPPSSLEKALRLFFVGAAIGCIEGADGRGNRSMMIHPSQRRDLHKQFVAWTRSTKTAWLNLLRDTKQSPDRRSLMAEFRNAHEDLQKTDPTLPPFEKVEEDLEYAIHRTQITEINASAGRIPTIKWKQNYSYILVGGTGLDRGFTVEGLTVTYMPRGAGVGNADTVQQRGRFFGYKRDYLGLVRIFLEPSVQQAFEKYVEHERSIRKSLVAFRDSGKPLSEWRRAFFLDRSMSPTRSSVLSLDYMRGRGKEWIYPRRPHLGGVLKHNQQIVSDFLKRNAAHFSQDPGDSRRTLEQIHRVASNLPLAAVYRDLLVPLTATGDDLLDHVHVLLQVERSLERNKHARCVVYEMAPDADRSRGVDKSKAIKNLMQGENEKTGYPGDRAIRSTTQATIQVHLLKLTEGDRGKGKVVAAAVPVVALSLPDNMRADILHEQVNE